MPLRHTNSITRRLARMNIMVTGVALLLACAAFFTYDRYTFRSEVVRGLSVQAQIIGSNSISAVVFDDSHAAEKTLSALRSAPHILLAEIHKPDGSIFATYRRTDAVFPSTQMQIPAGREELHGWQKNHVFLVRKLALNGQDIGTLTILTDLGEMKDREINFTIIVAMVLLVSLGASMWVSSFARRSIVQPIVQLSETARIISRDKNYSVRAEGVANKGEILSLVTTFNGMLDQIQARDAALLNARADLERKIQERTAQLRAANTELEAFSYSVSHDLRAPLRHINGFSTLLREEYGSAMDAGAQRYLQKIQDGTKRMGELIEDLLRMAQIGRKELMLTPTDFNLLLKSALAEIQPECVGRQIDWKISDLPVTECDSGLIKQVFANLLSNALKYSRKRDIAVIEIGYFEENGAGVFFVRDNGAGFDPQYAGKLFGVFQRLHRSDEFEGTGVGLATVKRILQKHGGNVWATSELGKGAIFFFSLPKDVSGMQLQASKGGLARTANSAN